MAIAAGPIRGSALASLALAVALHPAPSLRAQAPAPTFTEKSDVTLVEVPVTVTGKNGEPVRGLTAADFEITDEGAPQAIEALDVVDLSSSRELAEESWRIPPSGRRHLLFLFDLSQSSPGTLGRAREAAALFIRDVMAPADLGAVATISIPSGLRLLVTFTGDRNRIAAAVSSVGLPSSFGALGDPLAFTFRAQTEATPAPGDAPPGPSGVGVSDFDQAPSTLHQKSADEYAADQAGRQLTTLGLMAGALDAIAGRKVIVFFSEGFDGLLLTGEMVADGDALFRGQLWNINTERRYGNTRLQDVFGQTMALFRRSNCAIFPIDIGGTGYTGDRRREALDAMAQETEGESIHGENDFVQALRRVHERTSLTYVLYFRPTRRQGEGAYHALKVKVRRSGARVSARAGYFEKRGFSSWTPLQRALAAADVISQERPADGFPVRVFAFCLPSPTLARVPVVAEIPGESLLPPGAAGEKLRLGIYVYAVAEDGQVRDFRTRSVGLDLARETPRLRSGPLRYAAQLALPAGRYRIRVLVRDEALGRSGFQAISLEVPPEASADALLWGPPLFVADEDGVALRDGAGRTEPASEPLELAGKTFLPQTEPSVSAGQAARLCLLLRSAPGASEVPGLEIAARLREDGRPDWSEARLTIVGRTVPDPTGLWKVVLEFTPGSLPAGRYWFAVTIREPRSRRSSVGQTTFRVS